MKTLGKFLAAAACLAASVQFVAAADAPQIYEVDEPQQPGNWYLRGDIGYVIPTDPDVTYGGSAVSFINEKLDPTWMIGGGIGYRYNPWFRTDVTIDYRFHSDFSGNTVCGGCGGGLSQEGYKLSTTTFLLNAYYDFGAWQGFTPYVGAGAGFAYHWLSDLVGVNPGGAVTIVPDGGKWTWAAAVMAGVSVPVGARTEIDAGYRYLWLGDAESGTDGIGNRVEFSDLGYHEIRVGARHNF